jgi:general transcription factor 3C polypeptide 5 (transcription factor C subunit 1)
MQSSPSTSQQSTEAPERPLPPTPYFSVEYPGYVRPTSIPLAINNLGGQSSIDNAFKRTATKTDALLELSLRPGNPFAHPVPGDVVGTSNVLLKVVKRKRRRVEGQAEGVVVGEYTAEAVGVISKTVRFRSKLRSYFWKTKIQGGCVGMVDYQYQVDPNDPVAKLRLAMDNMDGTPLLFSHSILAFFTGASS